MPTALIAEIMFMTLCDFFAKRYLTANLSGRFIAFSYFSLYGLFFQEFINVLRVVE